MATLQQQVQQHLQNTGISLRELSRRSGVSHTTIGKILRGGNYKSDTAHALYSLISITPIGEYVTLHDKVEQLAADRVDCDRGAWDTDLQCAKYRRVMQLEKELEQSKAEVGIVREQRNKLAFACEQLTADLEAEKRNFAALEQVHEHVAGNLKSCESALIEAHTELTATNQKLSDANAAYLMLHAQHSKQEQQLSDANTEIKRLTALSEMHGQSWKAACVQVEQLQKQLDHGQAVYSKLYNQLGATRTKYETQLEAANQKEARLQEQLTEVYATKTRQEAQIMRLRVYVWSLIAALVSVSVSGLVVWGGV